jgi:hypothetical protein
MLYGYVYLFLYIYYKYVSHYLNNQGACGVIIPDNQTIVISIIVITENKTLNFNEANNLLDFALYK